jgi:hypothetical protein
MSGRSSTLSYLPSAKHLLHLSINFPWSPISGIISLSPSNRGSRRRAEGYSRSQSVNDVLEESDMPHASTLTHADEVRPAASRSTSLYNRYLRRRQVRRQESCPQFTVPSSPPHSEPVMSRYPSPGQEHTVAMEQGGNIFAAFLDACERDSASQRDVLHVVINKIACTVAQYQRHHQPVMTTSHCAASSMSLHAEQHHDHHDHGSESSPGT